MLLWTRRILFPKHWVIMNVWSGLRGFLEIQRPSGFNPLCGKPALFMGFSGFYYIHYPQALLGVDSSNCLHWNDRPCKTECAQNLRFTTHLPRLRVSPSEVHVTAGTSPPTLLGKVRRGESVPEPGGGLVRGPSAVPVSFNFTQHPSHQ